MQEVKTEKIEFTNGRRGHRVDYFVCGPWAINYLIIVRTAERKHCDEVYLMGGKLDQGTYPSLRSRVSIRLSRSVGKLQTSFASLPGGLFRGPRICGEQFNRPEVLPRDNLSTNLRRITRQRHGVSLSKSSRASAH